MFYKLQFFRKSKGGICANDFKNSKQIERINLDFILSLTDIQKFNMPLSGDFVGKYASITMSNDDTFFIDEESFKDLSKYLVDLTLN